jgi:acetyl esterase/lipase
MIGFLRVVITMIALLIAWISIFFLIRFRTRRWIYLVVFKMLGNSLAPNLALIGMITAALGSFVWAPLAIVAGTVGMVISTIYVLRVTKSHSGFEKAFGIAWQEKIPPELRDRMLPHRWTWKLPRLNKACPKNEIPFWTITARKRRLVCDIWQPSSDIPRSGIGLIYLHGSAWHYSDKDFGTRPFFSHLVAQGHVAMDVAYRLCPEVDLWEMVGDVKRAVAWLKANAGQYGVDPDKIVLAGGSAGAHLALLAAYTALNPLYTPDDLREIDLFVKGVVSYYGPTDLETFFQDGFGRVNLPSETEKIQKNLLGGLFVNKPEVYHQASPVAHISPDCPATLIFQGSHDMGVPVESTRLFCQKLVDSGVPSLYVEFPQTDHGFDLQLRVLKLGDGSQYSAAAQAAAFDLDRFLALMASSVRVEPEKQIAY